MKNIIEIALDKKGQFASAEWSRPCKTLKSCNHEIVKRTIAKNVRIGANYENLQTTIEGRASGELPNENQGLRGLEWVNFPVVLKNPKTERQFIRLETAKNSKFITQYFIDGQETTKDEIESYLQASEKSSGEMPTVMNIGVDTIINLK